MPNPKNNLHDYLLMLGDNALVLAQRLSAWCGHAPVLEIDMALTNISLDLFGQARAYYQYACSLENTGRDEDQLAFLRDAMDFRNLLLVEQPNGDFANTIVRQFLFDAFHLQHLEALRASNDEQLAAIAQKALKEVQYHFRFSSDWVLRLGDGTAESNQRMQTALNHLWVFTDEFFKPTQIEQEMASSGISPDLHILQPLYIKKITSILQEATLHLPSEGVWMQGGGKLGQHSEHLGFLLAEMQWMQRAYPNMSW